MKITTSDRLDSDNVDNKSPSRDSYDVENGRNENIPQGGQEIDPAILDHRERVEEGDLELLESLDENLGEDFELTRWLPPSIEKATEFRKGNVYRGGDASLFRVNVTTAPDLAVKSIKRQRRPGVSLYFQFTQSASICFFVMSIFAIPSLILSFYGNKISLQNRDAIGMYKFTIGNIGYDSLDTNYHNNSKCTAARTLFPTNGHYNGTCIHLLNYELTMPETVGILTACEILQIISFFCFIFHLSRVTNTIKVEREKLICSVSDYSVIVKNIPSDTTKEELIAHFNSLYPLDEKDWLGRPPVALAKVTQHYENSLVPAHLHTWIAECTIHKAIGRYLRAFKDKQAILMKLQRCRAQMKMYAEGTPHAHGANGLKWLKAEENMEKIGESIDTLTEHVVNSKNIKFNADDNDCNDDNMTMTFPNSPLSPNRHFLSTMSPNNSPKGKKESEEEWNNGSPSKVVINMNTTNINTNTNINLFMNTNMSNTMKSNDGKLALGKSLGFNTTHHKMDLNNHIIANTICGLITFEYSESMARAVEDSRRYSTFPFYFFFYPSKLKFRGQKISVSKAPEPDEIMWENLEISQFSKSFRRTRTGVVTFILLFVCFTVTLQASLYQGRAIKSQPYPLLCNKYIPELYNTDRYKSITLERSPMINIRMTKDIKCNSILPGSFNAQYSFNKDYGQNGTNGLYNYETCSTINGFCPQKIKKNVFCPCVSTTSSQECFSSSCPLTPTSTVSDDCEPFTAKEIGSCYCLKNLQLILSATGFSGVYSLLSDKKNVCRTFTFNYIIAEGLIYAIVIFSTFLNMFLESCLVFLTQLESHTSVDKRQGSLSFKFFLAVYLNMTFTALIAYGNIPGLPKILVDTYIFQGPYTDFSPEWFSSAGVYFMTAFIVQSVVPLITQFIPYYIILPLRRLLQHSAIRKRMSHTIVMQSELNKLQVGPPFDSTIQTSHLLALIFFGMTYAPGLPLLMPMACISSIMFFVGDKILLLRYYQKPPHISEQAMRIVLSTLPYAVLIRLSVAIWMFGNTKIFSSNNNNYFDIIPFKLKLMNIPKSTEISSVNFLNFLNKFKNIAGSEYNFLEKRIFQPQTFPLFIFFLLIIIIKLLLKYYTYFSPHKVFLSAIICVFNQINCLFKHKKVIALDGDGRLLGFKLMQLDDDLRQESAPYTGEYYKFLQPKLDSQDQQNSRCTTMRGCCCPHSDVDELTARDIDEDNSLSSLNYQFTKYNSGWEQVEQGDYLVKVKKFNVAVSTGGVVRSYGERKRTYEVVQDDGINSYNIENIPAYKHAVIGLKEGISSLLQGLLLQGDSNATSKTKRDRRKFRKEALHMEKIYPDDLFGREREHDRNLDHDLDGDDDVGLKSSHVTSDNRDDEREGEGREGVGGRGEEGKGKGKGKGGDRDGAAAFDQADEDYNRYNAAMKMDARQMRQR